MCFQLASCVKLKMNVLVEIPLKKRNGVKPNRPKNKLLKTFQTALLCRTPKISQAGKRSIFKNLSNGWNLSVRETLSDPPVLSTRKNSQNLKMFQVATNIGSNVGSYTQVRIAGDFLSSRKAARAERCTPKTTDAALDG